MATCADISWIYGTTVKYPTSFSPQVSITCPLFILCRYPTLINTWINSKECLRHGSKIIQRFRDDWIALTCFCFFFHYIFFSFHFFCGVWSKNISINPLFEVNVICFQTLNKIFLKFFILFSEITIWEKTPITGNLSTTYPVNAGSIR